MTVSPLTQSPSIDAPRATARDVQPGRDIIFVSMEQWDEIWRRNQFLCAAYAIRHPDRKVLFVAPPIDVTNAVRHGRFSEFRGPRTWVVPEHPNITVTQPLKIAPSTFALGRRLNDWLARAHVKQVARSLGIAAPILWLNPHWAVHMAGEMGEAAVIYDVTDDWTALTQGASSTELVLQQDAELCGKADAVIVCSQRLFDLKRPTARRLHLIPNGVDAEHYQLVLGSENGSQEVKWRRPVLGYTGTIHPDRVDVDLLEAIARKWEGSIVLIGPNQLRPADLAKLDLPNIISTGAVPYSRLPELMRGFDVCIVPHRVTPFTESLNPIKLWEYLAAGKPIVSTDVAGFRDYPQFVRLARNAEEFVNAAKQGQTESASLPHMRRAEARRHSWQSRLDQVESVIEQCIRSCRSSS